MRRPARRLALPLLASLLLPLLLLGPEPRADEPVGRPLDAFFHGKVELGRRGKVTLTYDFEAADQAEDWVQHLPFPMETTPEDAVTFEDGRLAIRGNTGVRHVAEFDGAVEVSCVVTPLGNRDMGGYVMPADETPSFVTYTLLEKYFHRKDRRGGGDHSILKFGAEFRESGYSTEYTGFRYVADRGPRRELVENEPVELSFELDGNRLKMKASGVSMSGRDPGIEVERAVPGFYTLKGKGMDVDDVVIEGVLAPAWLEAQGLGLHLEEAD